MFSGVWLNGRQFKQGSHCSYLPRVQRRGNAAGVGGRLGSSTSYKIGTINMFYVFTMSGVLEPTRPRICVFASITDRPVLTHSRSMYIVNTVREELEKVGFEYEHLQDIHSMIHVDSITSKVMLVPHYDEDKSDSQMCGISMWETI